MAERGYGEGEKKKKREREREREKDRHWGGVSYSPLQNYWKVNSFVFAAYWRDLGVGSKNEYETKVHKYSLYLMIFTFRCVKQLTTEHLFFEVIHFLKEQKYWNM